MDVFGMENQAVKNLVTSIFSRTSVKREFVLRMIHFRNNSLRF